ncbi:MAG: response regulator [Caldilineaceae bacterium]|nr:response regulator [Caldilineaceae bacterium]
MQSSKTERLSARAPEIRETLRDLQDHTVTYVLPALYAIGLILILSGGQWSDLYGAILGMLLLVVSGAAWLLRTQFYMAAVITLISGCFVILGLAIFIIAVPVALILLALPVGLTLLLINKRTGVIVAILCTLLLFMPHHALHVEPSLRIIAIVQIWGIVGLIWLTSHSLVTAMIWFRTSYEHSRMLLERARDHRLEMSQVVAELGEANRQLLRLHRLANSLRENADEARRAKEEFVANVSHELRTPLNMIIGFTELVLQAPHTYGNQIPQALLADLNVVLRNSQHLSALIDDVLDLSQIEAGQMALSKEWVDLSQIVEGAVATVRPLYALKDLYLQTQVASDLPSVHCDPIRMRQVILNLLSNAGRFTEEGGVIVGLWRDGDHVLVSVADTGPGIAHDDLERVFQPFQQADNSIRKRYGGSGLGLSISRGFVELHDGKMWVDSTVGSGTTITFRLPTGDAAQDRGALRWFTPYMRFEEESRPGRSLLAKIRPRLVVAERGRSLERLLARYLDRAEIVAVKSLDEAVIEVERTPSQMLLINDSNMGDNFQRLEGVRLPNGLPVVLCSVPGTDEYALSLGVSAYLIKPVARERLLGVLEPFAAKKVLLVDDDPNLLRLFRRMLASANRGYQVLRAKNGRQALQVLTQDRPDVVILDLLMPEMDGFQLLAQKNADPALREIPVIIVSSQDPNGQPIVSRSLIVTRSGGISIPQFLGCIEGISQLLSAQPVAMSVQQPQEVVLANGLAQESRGAEGEG